MKCRLVFARCLEAHGIGVHGGPHHGPDGPAHVDSLGVILLGNVQPALGNMVCHALFVAVEKAIHLSLVFIDNVVEERL